MLETTGLGMAWSKRTFFLLISLRIPSLVLLWGTIIVLLLNITLKYIAKAIKHEKDKEDNIIFLALFAS